MKPRAGCWIGAATGLLILWAAGAMLAGQCVLEGELVDPPEGLRCYGQMPLT